MYEVGRGKKRASSVVGMLFMLTIAVGVSCAQQQATDREGQSMYEIGGGKQLFIDDRFIESKEGLTRQVNPPAKMGPVLMPETPIESGYLGALFSFLEDPAVKGRYLMYYLAQPKKGETRWVYPGTGKGDEPGFHLCRAVSYDGIHWERERVGLFEIGGSRDNNVVLLSGHFRDTVTVFSDPQAEDGCPFKGVGLFMEPGGSFSGLYLWRS